MSANKSHQVAKEFQKQNSKHAKTKRPKKKGGPYSKNDKEARRNEVHRLYFEYNYPARKIAKLMNINRNTINEDIKFWYLQIHNEIGGENLVLGMIKHIHGLELQMARLYEELKETSDFEKKLAIEKLLFEIGNRLAQLFIKIRLSGQESLNIDSISEDEIKKFVRHMILKNKSNEEDFRYTEDKIKSDLMHKIRCDSKYASRFFNKMLDLGLGIFDYRMRPIFYEQRPTVYDLVKFANLRRYISADEFAKINKKRLKIQEEIKKLEENEIDLASSNLKDSSILSN